MFPFELKHRIAFLNVYSEIAFHASVAGWRNELYDSSQKWHRIDQQTKPLVISERDVIELDGDCIYKISAKDGGVVHINGDLNSNLEIGGHHEVIIHGNVTENATIMASGFHSLFISGSMNGQLCSTDSGKIWVENDFVGSLETGAPSTSLHIGGDYRGSIAPYTEAALLWMTVKGFASQESMRDIAKLDYTVFDASVGKSDVDPGFYPLINTKRNTRSGSHWCVGLKR